MKPYYQTYTIRPEGQTAWVEHIPESRVEREYGRATDMGLQRILIVRDSDGKTFYRPEQLMEPEIKEEGTRRELEERSDHHDTGNH